MSLGRKLKGFLHAKSTPEFLFSLYFNWKNDKDKRRLFEVLESGDDLLEHVGTGAKAHWVGRIQDVLDCSDNKDIPRHELAGQIVDRQLYMHNGIKVDPLSYYNYPMLKMLMDNKGVHEPQEEKIFQETIASLPKNGKKKMLELGSYWSFYTIWFKKHFPNADCVMVEPDRKNLTYGKRNLKLNGMNGKFVHAGIGKQVDRAKNITTVDAICEQYKIDFLDILHSDIQGFELEMLQGSEKLFSNNGVGYAFISTHSNELHEQCHAHLSEKYGFQLVASANLDQSYSWDGILVMKAPDYPGIDKVDIAKKIKQPI